MIQNLLRDNIRGLSPYSSARDEYTGQARVWLDANENPVNTDLNRYPDPTQSALRRALAARKGVLQDQVIIGNGSDELIDLMIRAFCEPGVDRIIVTPPTYGMYTVCADINAVEVVDWPLTREYTLDTSNVPTCEAKLIFLCSPNNPTGSQLPLETIEWVFSWFNGIVVVDEAYIDFADGDSAIDLLTKYDRLMVLQTFSKAWGLAGARLGIGYASRELVEVLNKVKPPYNVNTLSARAALDRLKEDTQVGKQIRELRSERDQLARELVALKVIRKVYPSQANFLLVEVDDPGELYAFLLNRGIVVRDRSTLTGCQNCLRITIGKPIENQALLTTIKQYEDEKSTVYR